MSEPLYVITGATGHVGSIVANQLLAQKKRVRVIGRDAGRLQPFKDRGAETAVGSLEDSAFVQKALQGASALFAMIPPNFTAEDFLAYQLRVTQALTNAVRADGLTSVVTLSSVGAHLPEGNGPVKGLYELERALDQVPNLNVLHLRASYFLENHLNSIGMIKSQNVNAGAFKPDLAFPMIATKDIGDVAAKRLAALDFKGHNVLELMGAKDVSMNDLTQTIGKAIGKPELKYVQAPYDEVKKGMVGMHVPEPLAHLYMEMTRGFNEGKIKPTQPRTGQTTTATSMESFVNSVFLPAFRA